MSYAGTKALICKSIRGLRDAYPSLFVGTEDQWQKRESTYYQKLRRYDVELIDDVCDRATDVFPKFPDAFELVKMCKATMAERRQRERDDGIASDRIRADRDNANYVEDLRASVIPHDHVGQEAFTAAGDTPFERLARAYETDSKRSNIDPNSLTKLHGERFAQFWVAWGETEQSNQTTTAASPHGSQHEHQF